MALKSETLLQTPPIVLGSASMNINDDKLSNDEDLEDGEIFDDDEDNNDNEATAASSNTSSQKSVVPNNCATGAVQNNSVTNNSNSKDNKSKDNVIPDSATTFSKIATLAAADSSCSNNNLKNESQSGYVPSWRNSNANVASGSENVSKKTNLLNEEDNHKRSSRDKKKKRKRLKNGDDDKHIKEKRAKRSSEKDDISGENSQRIPEDEEMEGDDDDEMLFIRGASPTMFHYSKRHHRNSRDEDDDRLQEDEEDDFVDEDDDFDDEDDDENGERRRRLSDLPGGLDRAARRERLLARGKRRSHGGANRDGNNKRRKDEGEICKFYLQGKCHKGGECPFSHDAMPHKKMELCKFYLMDCCNKKDKCLYLHSEFPCKYFHMGLKCYANKNCKFSHAKLSDVMRQVFIKTFGPVNSRGNKDFPSKKGSSSKHRQDGDFSRGGAGRDNSRRGSEPVNKRNGPGNVPEKKIPSLFDIKVSIPTEMRNNNNMDNNNHSDSDGNHTPMPSPTHMQHMSDSSRSSPPPAVGRKKRKKERKTEKSKKSDGHRGDRNEGANNNKRIPLMLMNNDTNWDEMMLEHQRMQQQMLAELAAGNFADDSDHNDDEDDRHCNNNDQFFGSQHDNYNSNSNNSNSSSNNKSSNLNEDSTFSNALMSSHRSPSPQNDSDTGGALQIATQSNDSSNEMFPAHLPKKQRELFLRIKQQQRQACDTGNNGGGRLQIAEDSNDESNENNEKITGDKNSSSISSNAEDKNKVDDDDYDNKSKQHDENWYSSDEEDEQQPSSGTSSLNAILQNLVRLNTSNTGNLSPSTLINSQTSVNSIFSSIQPAAVISATEHSVSSSGGVNSISTSGITNVDFDVNEVSALLSKVKEHFQSSEKKTVRDPRLSRSDVGPNSDTPNSVSNSVSTTVTMSFSPSLSANQNTTRSTLGNEDVDLRVNAGNRVVAAGDMDLRNLPFKPAPVHSAATEIDASINSHSPLPYRLIPFIVAKTDYSSIQPNSKVGAADPRLRKTVRVSEESSSVVSSRDPRHRLIDNFNKEKKTVPPPVQNSDPRQRARATPPAGIPNMIPTTMGEELQLPPSLMLSQLRSAFPMMPGPGSDMGMMCPPTPRSDDEPPTNFMVSMPTRPTDPRQRPMQMNLPPAGQIPPNLFEALNAMQNNRQPNFLSQPGDPRTRPPAILNMPNAVFPGTPRSNDPVIRGQFNFK